MEAVIIPKTIPPFPTKPPPSPHPDAGKMLPTSSSAPSLSRSSMRPKKVAGKGKAHRRPLPNPPQSRTSAGEQDSSLPPSHQRYGPNVPQHLTYVLKPDSPFQNYTTPRSSMPVKASHHVKRSVVHGKWQYWFGLRRWIGAYNRIKKRHCWRL